MATQAQRYNALEALHARFEVLPDNQIIDRPMSSLYHVAIYPSRFQLAEEIRELLPLGRTDRWKEAINKWATMVETHPEISWAFLQYGVHAAYAAR